jgi:tyrosyl-DNA phosphodiesterase 1
MASPAAKRRRIASPADQHPPTVQRARQGQGPDRGPERGANSRPNTPLNSLNRDITPPPRSTGGTPGPALTPKSTGRGKQKVIQNDGDSTESEDEGPVEKENGVEVVRSPFQLTRIRNLPASHNIDTINLSDIIGDPLIRELWLFDYLFDLDFVMQYLDPDVKSLVRVKIIHGSWKKEDGQRIRLEEQAKQYPNVHCICAHMPEAFGTHHSKMIILFKHDDTARVIIHTANMIDRDWANLAQGVWGSPVLPLLDPVPAEHHEIESATIGTGLRFKSDLLRYLRRYEGRTRSLVNQLRLYDFGAVRAALIASVPSRQDVDALEPEKQTAWGWLGLKQILSRIPCSSTKTDVPSIIAQISSIAMLSETWINSFLDVLATHMKPTSFVLGQRKPQYKIIFPTADEVRRSLDGYAAGASMHMRIQSAAQQKQLNLLRPMLCHWASDAETSSPSPYFGTLATDNSTQVIATGATRRTTTKREAKRNRAAPHIKTYIRFKDKRQTEIEWAMLTSANLSQQAWGALTTKDGTVRICSYEIGVVVWPALFADDFAQQVEVSREMEQVKMVPVFGRDEPTPEEYGEEERGNGAHGEAVSARKKIVGLRMPYDLPLVPYQKHEMPWCATAMYTEPDWMNRVWGVEGNVDEVDNTR